MNTTYRKISKHAFTILIILVCCLLVKSSYDIRQLKNKLYNARSDSKVYYDEAIKNQLKYEETRDVLDKSDDDLNRTRDQLATVKLSLDASAKREKAAKARASRSRHAEIKPRVVEHHVDVPHVQPLPTPSRKHLYGGRLYDITKYCPTGNLTASDKVPERGMVATLDRSIPFGTSVVIDGLGTYIVEDRIGYGSEFDIFTQSCSEADQFGREHRTVSIG